MVNADKQRIVKEAPPLEPGAIVDRPYELRLHDYYGFPYSGRRRCPTSPGPPAVGDVAAGQRLRAVRYLATAALWSARVLEKLWRRSSPVATK